MNLIDRIGLAWPIRLLLSDGPPEHQAGAIPYALVENTPVFLLITSRRTGRWIFPKGSLPGSKPPRQLAAEEAFEEAGVKGRTAETPVGSYQTWKTRGLSRVVIEVEMYPLLVEKQLDSWPEKGQRFRHWATRAEARRLLSDKPLYQLVEAVADAATADSASADAA